MTTVSALELSWTLLSGVGFAVSLYLGGLAWRDRRRYLGQRREGVEVEVANRDARTAGAFALITLLYLLAGLSAMFAPSNPNPSTSLPRLVTIWALIATNISIIIVQVFNLRSRRRIRHYFQTARVVRHRQLDE
jgi:hypothetical protein